MLRPSTGLDAGCPVAETAWEALALIDTVHFAEWTGDLTREQVRDILAMVPRDGRATVDAIGRAVAAGDLASARRLAHRLKGMAANLGAARLAEIARTAELSAGSAADFAALMTPLGETLDATIGTIEAMEGRS